MHALLSRRAALIALTAPFATALLPRSGLAGDTPLYVVKDPNCGCCSAWVDVMQAAGFAATVEERDAAALQAHKVQSGIPAAMISCHTAHIDGYVIEGHVPPADIRRLLQMRPDAIGLSVPGMPYGSPGMGPETEREAYAVHLIHRDGSTSIFATYAAA